MNEELIRKAGCAILGLFFGFLFGFLWEKLTLRIDHLAHRNGHHYHHSLFGLLVFLFIPMFWDDLNQVLLIAGFGIGVILHHTIKEGFIFLTKD